MNAFWINSKTNHIYLVRRRHIDFIKENLELFGITKEYIDYQYKKYNEPKGFEGKARNKIIHQLLNKGWIRIRLNTRTNTWHINHNYDIKHAIVNCQKWFKDYAGTSIKTFKFIHTDGKTKEIDSEELNSIYNLMNSGKCLDCEYSTWAVGVGQGFFCNNEDKLKIETDNLKISSTGFKRFMIPRKDYYCEFFEPKNI